MTAHLGLRAWLAGTDGHCPPEQTITPHQIPSVCHIVHSLSVGGAEILATRLARQLGTEMRAVFVCLDELGSLGEQLRAQGFRIYVLGRRPGFDWRCARRLAAVIQQERIDLVHAHQYTSFFYAAMARIGFAHPPILFTEHGREFPDHPRRKRILANRVFLRQCDCVVGVGEAVRQALIDNEGIAARRVSVVVNGIDQSRYSYDIDPEDRWAVRTEMGAGTGDVLVLQVARLDFLKDHATALQTLAEVIRHRSNVRLALAGTGPEDKAIRQAIDTLNLGAHVRLLGLRADIPRLMQAADIALLTSISEGIPLTLIEAMAAARPVISTRVGGVSEIVVDGQTGLLAPAGDHIALAAALIQLVDNPEARQSMGASGKKLATQQFTETRMVDAYRQMYLRMLSIRSPG